MEVTKISKNTYNVSDNNGNWVTIRVYTDFNEDVEILLNGDLSNDNTIFIPGVLPTESIDDFAIIGTVKLYSFVENSNVKATLSNSSLVMAKIIAYSANNNQTFLQAKNYVEMAFIS